jgi:hypothetical protein
MLSSINIRTARTEIQGNFEPHLSRTLPLALKD